MSKLGAAALFLKAFCKGKCRSLAHVGCGASRCPCEQARVWLRSLSSTLTPEEGWAACNEITWMVLVTERLGLSCKGYTTCDAIRGAYSWSVILEAAKKPTTMVKCDDCDEFVEPDDIRSGHCEDCSSNYDYCNICDDDVSKDSLCDHLEWSDSAVDTCGTGSNNDVDHHESFDTLLTRLGLRHCRKLRIEMANSTYWSWSSDRALTESISAMRDRARDTGDLDRTEVGVIWLRTLDKTPALSTYVTTTIGWIDQHIARREAAIAADPRPMRVVRDGAGRYYVRGEWAAIREQAEWMVKSRAGELRRGLKKLYPTAGIKVVHVLTAAPVMGEK